MLAGLSLGSPLPGATRGAAGFLAEGRLLKVVKGLIG
jgi:hypothetical protein